MVLPYRDRSLDDDHNKPWSSLQGQVNCRMMIFHFFFIIYIMASFPRIRDITTTSTNLSWIRILLFLILILRTCILTNLSSFLQQEGFGESTWTIDLCYILYRWRLTMDLSSDFHVASIANYLPFNVTLSRSDPTRSLFDICSKTLFLDLTWTFSTPQ